MSTDLKNTDLVKYLNYRLLHFYPELAHYLNIKNQINPTKPLN